MAPINATDAATMAPVAHGEPSSPPSFSTTAPVAFDYGTDGPDATMAPTTGDTSTTMAPMAEQSTLAPTRSSGTVLGATVASSALVLGALVFLMLE